MCPAGQFRVVGNEHQRSTSSTIEVEDEVHDTSGVVGVKVAGGFIGRKLSGGCLKRPWRCTPVAARHQKAGLDNGRDDLQAPLW